MLPPVDETPEDQKDPKLVNFTNPRLVPGSFFFVFKTEEQLKDSPPGPASILDGTLPTSDQSARALAEALTEGKGKLGDVVRLEALGLRGFYVSSMTKEAAKALVSDPRIERVEAEPILSIDTT